MKNPYKRVKEINAELEALTIQEMAFKKRTWKRKPKELEKVESDIMWLCFEKIPIEETIKWFEKKFANVGEGVA